jgi:hypothetical protein
MVPPPSELAQLPFSVDVSPSSHQPQRTVHFDFGDPSESPGASRLWRGSYHVTVYADRAAMGAGVSHKAILEGQAVSDEDIAPLTPGRAWRLTVRGELQERPERARVSFSGHQHVDQSTRSLSLRAGFELLESRYRSAPACQVLTASRRAKYGRD